MKIYYSDSSSEGKDYAIVDISSKKAKYTKATYDSSNPSTSYDHIYEPVDMGYATDSSVQDNVNLKTCSRVALKQEGNQHITVQFNSQPYVRPDINNNESTAVPIYDSPDYDDLPPPRPVTVIENLNFHAPVEQYYDDSNLLGLSEFPC